MTSNMALRDSRDSNTLSERLFDSNSDVRLLHWWVSDGEIEALNVLKQALRDSQLTCDDTPVSGGDNMLSDLNTMVSAGNFPTAAVMTGHSTQYWAQQGVLGDLTELSNTNHWDALVPEAIQPFCKYKGRWIGVPVSLHSINWLWINSTVSDRIGLHTPLVEIEDLFAALELAKRSGVVPLAIGGDAWLMATLFDTVVLSTNGADFYNQAFMEFDEAVLKSTEMIDAFRTLRRLAGYTDVSNHKKRRWSDATRMVIEGEALMEVSGDWARAEYRAAGKVFDTDYACIRFPGTEDKVLFNADIFVVFDVPQERREAQLILAETMMDSAFQKSFNDAKGSAPVSGCDCNRIGSMERDGSERR